MGGISLGDRDGPASCSPFSLNLIPESRDWADSRMSRFFRATRAGFPTLVCDGLSETYVRAFSLEPDRLCRDRYGLMATSPKDGLSGVSGYAV